MQIEKQVVSLELAKKLKELGVKQESAFYWHGNRWKHCVDLDKGLDKPCGPYNHIAGTPDDITWSAFTVAELGEMLPYALRATKGSVGWRVFSSEDHFETADTEADARAKMLIYLIENGIIKP